MSTEGGGGNTSSSRRDERAVEDIPLRTQQQPTVSSSENIPQPAVVSRLEETSENIAFASESGRGRSPPSEDVEEKKPAAREEESVEKPRQVIAVSASKGPAAFFNLARKFLVTDELCDLSALEGAIVSAVDAAHLLERSKLATIVRVQTSYVTVEPKRRKQETSPVDILGSVGEERPPTLGSGDVSGTSAAELPASRPSRHASVAAMAHAPLHHHPTTTTEPQTPSRHRGGAKGSAGAGGRELRRARIVITVRRTEGYKQWLDENPLQAIIAGDGDDEEEPEPPPGSALAGSKST